MDTELFTWKFKFYMRMKRSSDSSCNVSMVVGLALDSREISPQNKMIKYEAHDTLWQSHHGHSHLEMIFPHKKAPFTSGMSLATPQAHPSTMAYLWWSNPYSWMNHPVIKRGKLEHPPVRWICKLNLHFVNGEFPASTVLNMVWFTGLVERKIYRKPYSFPDEIGFPCQFSVQPIHWMIVECSATFTPSPHLKEAALLQISHHGLQRDGDKKFALMLMNQHK